MIMIMIMIIIVIIVIIVIWYVTSKANSGYLYLNYSKELKLKINGCIGNPIITLYFFEMYCPFLVISLNK